MKTINRMGQRAMTRSLWQALAFGEYFRILPYVSNKKLFKICDGGIIKCNYLYRYQLQVVDYEIISVKTRHSTTFHNISSWPREFSLGTGETESCWSADRKASRARKFSLLTWLSTSFGTSGIIQAKIAVIPNTMCCTKYQINKTISQTQEEILDGR